MSAERNLDEDLAVCEAAKECRSVNQFVESLAVMLREIPVGEEVVERMAGTITALLFDEENQCKPDDDCYEEIKYLVKDEVRELGRHTDDTIQAFLRTSHDSTKHGDHFRRTVDKLIAARTALPFWLSKVKALASEIEALKGERDRLREFAARVVSWDKRFPKGTINPMRGMHELDEIVRDAKSISPQGTEQ